VVGSKIASLLTDAGTIGSTIILVHCTEEERRREAKSEGRDRRGCLSVLFHPHLKLTCRGLV